MHRTVKETTELPTAKRMETVGQKNVSLTFDFQSILIAGYPGF